MPKKKYPARPLTAVFPTISRSLPGAERVMASNYPATATQGPSYLIIIGGLKSWLVRTDAGWQGTLSTATGPVPVPGVFESATQAADKLVRLHYTVRDQAKKASLIARRSAQLQAVGLEPGRPVLLASAFPEVAAQLPPGLDDLQVIDLSLQCSSATVLGFMLGQQSIGRLTTVSTRGHTHWQAASLDEQGFYLIRTGTSHQMHLMLLRMLSTAHLPQQCVWRPYVVGRRDFAAATGESILIWSSKNDCIDVALDYHYVGRISKQGSRRTIQLGPNSRELGHVQSAHENLDAAVEEITHLVADQRECEAGLQVAMTAGAR